MSDGQKALFGEVFNLKRHWGRLIAKNELKDALKRRNEAQIIRLQPNAENEPSLVLLMSIPLQRDAE